jgi:glycine cleavage system H protein
LKATPVPILQDCDFPEHLLYDIENQIWYAPLDDGTVRTGFTAWSAKLMGDVLVFTPKRIGRDFEKNRSFAVVEGGKWVGAARAAFDGIVVAHNERLVRNPELMNGDAYGEGWMLIVRPSDEQWRAGLVTGSGIAPAFEAWFATDAYRDRGS